MTVNRHERRAVGVKTRHRLKQVAICGLAGHDYPGVWVMRPAWVGAGVSIPKVHFDRQCQRCGNTQRVWSDIEGDRAPLGEARPLPRWLEAHRATVETPPGEIRYPDVGELTTFARAAADGGEA